MKDYEPIVIENECELNEGEMPDIYDWIDTLQDAIYALTEKPTDFFPTEMTAIIKKSEWDEIEKGKVIKTHPTLRLEIKQ